MESLFDDITIQSIKQNIISNYTGDMDTRDGSFFDLIISPVTYEIYSCYKAMEEFLMVIYPDETSGSWLDLECAKYSITRKEGTKAACTVAMTGTANAVIAAGTAFLTEDGLAFELDEDVTLTGGSGSGNLTAKETGTEYNVGAGEINRMYVNAPGLTAYTNAAATGGTDAESSASLYARLRARREEPSASGCAADYKKWALSVTGIGAAHVTPLRDGAGTVTVFLADNDMGAVENAKIAEVTTYIESVRPIGASVTVVSCTETTIGVTATVTLDGTVSAADVKTAFEAALTSYFAQIGLDGGTATVSKIGYLLMGIDGVTDYSALELNNSTSNITLTEGTVAVMGTVTLTEAT